MMTASPSHQSLEDAETQSPASPQYSSGYQRYALVILLLAYTLSYVDRQIVTILAEHIKRDLHLADWQLGAITGLAFAIFYTGLGVPIGSLAQRVSRPAIIGASMLLWSVRRQHQWHRFEVVI
ncbi:MAG: hypothetical protein AB7V46_15640 [Thermomicrobiales bacterium]